MLDLFFSGVVYGSLLFVIAAGLTFVLGVLRVLNLAHASLFLLGVYITSYFATTLKIDIYLSIIIGALVVGFVGLVMERGLRILRGRPIEYQLLFTYSMILILYDLQLSLFGPIAKVIPVPEVFSGNISVLSWKLPKIGFLIIVVSLAILIFLYFFIHKTRFGIDTRAVSFDPEIAAILGVNPKRVYMLVFFLGTFITGLGAGFAGMWLPVSPPLWSLLNTLSFTIIVIGGVGSIVGAYIGSIITGIVYAFGITYFPSLSLVLPAILMAIVLVLRPRGLLGREVV